MMKKTHFKRIGVFEHVKYVYYHERIPVNQVALRDHTFNLSKYSLI